MQIITFELNHYNFYCPVTGKCIMEPENVNTNVPSLQGVWNTILDEPEIKNEKFQKDWEEWYEKKESGEFDNEFKDDENQYDYTFEKFFDEYPEDWVVFKICHYGEACGPVEDITWFVIDMNTTIDEEEDE